MDSEDAAGQDGGDLTEALGGGEVGRGMRLLGHYDFQNKNQEQGMLMADEQT